MEWEYAEEGRNCLDVAEIIIYWFVLSFYWEICTNFTLNFIDIPEAPLRSIFSVSLAFKNNLFHQGSKVEEKLREGNVTRPSKLFHCNQEYLNEELNWVLKNTSKQFSPCL